MHQRRGGPLLAHDMAAAFIMTINMTDVTVPFNISNMAAAIIMTIIMTKATIIISAIHLGRAGCFMRAAALPGAEAGLAFG